jgi:hypothetical protein
VNHIRSRLLAALLFGLLSLGQAYPFSVAWGMSGKSHACCCRTATPTPCGCDHASLKKKKFSCHQQQEDKSPAYKTAPCGAKTEAGSLNFRGENCLPRFASFVVTTVEALDLDDLSESLPKVSTVPDPPPPKQSRI